MCYPRRARDSLQRIDAGRTGNFPKEYITKPRVTETVAQEEPAATPVESKDGQHPAKETPPPKKKKKFLVQPMMVHVMVGLMPCLAAAVHLFGLRALVLTLFVSALGVATEGCFTLREGKPVTSAVLVTSLIFALSLPPNIPFWMAAVGIVFAVVFGKMVFGGFGFNAFNPAMAGRCFIYVAFPTAMTNEWFDPFPSAPGGFVEWSPPVDALTTATPLQVVRDGGSIPLEPLFLGTTSGSLGETAAWLVLAGGVYIIFKKSAPWRLAVSCLTGGILSATLLWSAGVLTANPLPWICAGSFLFGAFFVATEPITAPKNKSVQWIYGLMIGSLIMVFRQYSSFSEGVMFSVLFMNIFAAVMDIGAKAWKTRGKKAS